jgi:predicted NBD/HSP70 family sugar kinase
MSTSQENLWAIGVDLRGTKVEVAQVDATGVMGQRLRRPTDVKDGPSAVEAEIVATDDLFQPTALFRERNPGWFG